MNFRMLWLYILLPTVTCATASAQSDDWKIFYTSNSGLPENRVYCLTVDSTGVAWVGTYRGGARFDGTKWQTLDPSLIITCDDAITTRDGKVWIGSRGRLHLCDDTTITVYDNGVNDHFVEDSLGNIWGVGGATGYLSRFDRTNTISYGSDGGIADICIDSSQTKWYCRPGISGGIRSFDGVRWTQQTRPGRAIAVHPDGRVFLGDVNGISIFDGQAWKWDTLKTTNSGLPSNKINVIRFEEDGTMWVGTEFGIASYDGSTWSTYTSGNSRLPNDFIHDIDIDRKGNVWICTSNGLAVHNPDGVVLQIQPLAPAPPELEIDLWPQPVRSTLNFSTSQRILNQHVQVLDVLGRVAGSIDQENCRWFRGNTSAGAYMIIVKANGFLSSKKFIVID